MNRMPRSLMCVLIMICIIVTPLMAIAEIEGTDQELESAYSNDLEKPVTEATGYSIGESQSAEDQSVVSSEEESNSIDAENVNILNGIPFEDPVFYQYVLKNFDKDEDGYISDSEANKVTIISINNKGVNSLAGIEMFPKLHTLKCYKNNISQLDISNNTRLSTLLCYDNPLKELDIGASSTLLGYVLKIKPHVSSRGRLVYKSVYKGKSFDALSIPITTTILNNGAVMYNPNASLKLVDTSLVIFKNEKVQVLSEDSEVSYTNCTFSSGNTKVAKIDNKGIIKGVNPGTAKITVKSSNGQTKTCVVIVSSPTKPGAVVLSNSTLSLGVGQKFTLVPMIPKGTTTTYKWSTNNKKVATVTSGVVSAISQGTAKITVKTKNGMKATCVVTVTNTPVALKIQPATLSMKAGDTKALKVSFTNGAVGEVALVSEDPEIADVDSDTGIVYALKAGKTKIMALSANGLTATCDVEVTGGATPIDDPDLPSGSDPDTIVLSDDNLTMSVGQEVQLKATAFKNGKTVSADLRYACGNSSIVTADKNGILTALKVGSTEVTVVADNGVNAVCKIKVVAAPTSISLNTKKIQMEYDETLGIGEQYTLKATLAGSTVATISFFSSNEKVAVVNEEGLVTAVGIGTATVTAMTQNGKEDTCSVTVTGTYSSSANDLIVVAHRGGYTYAEENTLAAFSKTASTGADMVELDARTTKDGVEVVHHDASFKAGGHTYKIKRKKYSELIKVKPNLCTLDEALNVISKTNLTLQLELKDTADASKCVAAVRKYGMENRVVYISFKKDQLKKVRKLEPSARLGFCIEDHIPSGLNSTIKELKLYALMVKYDLLTESRLNSWHNAGLLVNVWTINTYDECLKWARMGVDFITSNYPEEAVRARKNA